MIDPIVHRNVGNEKRVDAFQTANVIAVLVRERAPAMVGVDAAHATEVVLRHMGVELVQPKMLLALNDEDGIQRDRCHHRALAPTDRAVASPGVHDAVRQIQFQHHRAAMAGQPMLGLDGDIADLMNAHVNLNPLHASAVGTR